MTFLEGPHLLKSVLVGIRTFHVTACKHVTIYKWLGIRQRKPANQNSSGISL